MNACNINNMMYKAYKRLSQVITARKTIKIMIC